MVPGTTLGGRLALRALLVLVLGCGGRSLRQERGDSERGGTGTELGGSAGTIGGSGSGGTIILGDCNASSGGSGICASTAYEIPRPFACDFDLPPYDASSGRFDPAKVNVTLNAGARSVTLYKLSGVEACLDELGWYYVDDANPVRIVLCPASCSALASGDYDALEVHVGCGDSILSPGPDAIPLDASDCASRPQGDCAGLMTCYRSNTAFDGAHALADCTRFSSFDGCGNLAFSFDVEGCATSVAPGESGWAGSDHLENLRTCLSGVFAGGRFDCLAASTFGYEESCFIP